MLTNRWVRLAAASAVLTVNFWSLPLFSLAGTTGGITGRVLDSQSRAAVAGVTVTASAPSATATSITDATGTYRFLTLGPDTYTLQFSKAGYDDLSQAGVTVLADQVQTVNVTLVATLRTIARVTSRSIGNLVKPGTTSDVYSVDAATAQATKSLAGPGGLSNAYGAIAAIPGVVVDTGEAGWFQQVHIRGGDIDQVGYELDGIPVNRVYDNAPQTMLSTLGQQELQVYTGGTPASADAQGIAGYVNQVIRTGTYPGFGEANFSVGTPAFFHRASVEAGGSTPDRLFSYYIGLSGADQDYNYLDNANGASVPNYFFYPFLLQNAAFAGPVYVGGSKPDEFAPGNTFGIANTEQRDSVVNLHLAIPHKNSSLRDDVQLLYLTSEVFANYYSSVNDVGAGLTGGALPWNDGVVYTGPLLQPVNPADAVNYYFPSSPPHAFDSAMPTYIRDTNDNGVAIAKLQYQHNFNDHSFLRAYGYLMYSNWFIWGPNSSDEIYGAELADYEIPDHTFGGNINYTNQLSEQHLLSVSGSYTGANLQRYSMGFVQSDPDVATLMTAGDDCYNGTTGAQTLCYDPAAQAGAADIQSGTVPPVTGAAAAAGAQYIATSGGIVANLNQVHTRFSSVSATDEWRPNDQSVFNLGLRIENFKYLLSNAAENPATEFWFNQYNQDYCYGPGLTSPQLGTYSSSGTVCPAAGEETLDALGPAYELSDTVNPSISTTRFEPRLSFTHTVNPDTVVRGSFGVYARPQNSSWVEYNTVQADLPSFLGQNFYKFGFRTPEHDIRPDTSYNSDLSLEKRLHGTDWTFKLTPFYRSTRDQLQNFFIDPLTGLESGLNVGHQVSSGVEVALVKGDFAHNGLAGQLGFTYTHSAIRYENFNGFNYNVIDLLNHSIQQYNSYTKACAGAAPSSSLSAPCGTYGGSNANPTFPGISQSTGLPDGATIDNPYYNQSAQPLLADNGWYSTYDVIPGPYSAENGYETPDVLALILNYKHDRFSITPSFLLSSGAKYGAPLAWPGYDPSNCGATLTGAASGPADPASCGVNAQTGLPLFIPDVYTGHYDNLGEFNEPWRFQASLAMSYEISPQVKATVSLTNIIDHCGQRGYAWDEPNVCVYGALPSGILPPAGNYYPNSLAASPPPQLQYPYTFLLNNNNTGFVGTRLPMEVDFNLQFKI